MKLVSTSRGARKCSACDKAARSAAWVLGAARSGLGLVALAAPQSVARPWVGEDAGTLGAKVLGRALGGRDIALGLGAMASLARDEPPLYWLAAGALADLVDSTVTAASFAGLPKFGRWVVLASAGGAAILGFAALSSFARPRPSGGTRP
jgi:hypothetical protein